MIHVLTHTDGKPCLYDSETGMVSRLPEQGGKKETKYFRTITEFMESELEVGAIPVYCTKRENIKKRFAVTLLVGTHVLKFFNVERIDDRWTKNDIEDMQPNRAYWVKVCKCEESENLILILSSKNLVK
jgi:hypothetical protein